MIRSRHLRPVAPILLFALRLHSSASTSVMHIVVLGSGVVGLSTALRLLDKGDMYHVTIIADAIPGDDKTRQAHWTSPWAGAQHVSFAAHDDPRQLALDRATFQAMWAMSAAGSDTARFFMRLRQTEYYRFVPDEIAQRNSPLDVMPDFRYLDENELLHDEAKAGIEFTTVNIDVPNYLLWLKERFLARGGTLVRARVIHIDQILRGAFTAAPVDALVVCAGLGARFLGGVEDKAVFPIRGQTVLIRAPWVDFGMTLSGGPHHAPGADVEHPPVYIIPRPSGDVILGGVMAPDDWYPLPRPETTTEILSRALTLAPQIAPPNGPADLRPLVIEEGCGLRPGRHGGIRLEVDSTRTDGKIIVYNYGHAGQGYQSSWGSADEAVRLLESALAI